MTSLEKISIEKRDEFIKRLADKTFAEFIAKTKDAQDSGTFRMIISDDSMDRQGDMVDQAGFDIENYMRNPVVLWGHDYFSMPVGITDRIYREGNKTIAEGRFAPTEEGQELRKYYESGMPCAASIGYIPKEGEGGKVTNLELLEWSFVAIPANPNCISAEEARQHNFNVEFLVTKGLIKIVEKKEKEKAKGDPCEMDDGTPGVMAKKPGEDGLVCVPAKDGKAIKSGAEISGKNKEKLKQIHEHSKTIDECTKAQRAVIEEMLKLNDGEDGEKAETPPSEQKSEASSSAMDVDDYIRVTNILKENLKAVVTLSNETLRGIKQAERRIKK